LAATQEINVIYGATVPVPVLVISAKVLTVAVASYSGKTPGTEIEPITWFIYQVEAQQEPPSRAGPPSLLEFDGDASTFINPAAAVTSFWSPAAAVVR